ncbi:MAG TPA: hypothetical protein VKK31_28005 [Thermoanaerobaculia bacterium]|nr:hypothetical protein [Thermoanaerobaculia bacterium]
MVPKKLVLFALAFALTAALPASALDRENKAPKESRRVLTPVQRSAAAQPQIRTSGKDNGKLRISRQRGPETPADSFWRKQECSFSCGSMTVTCSGGYASCTDSSCVAAGGGVILIAECVSN